MSKFILGKKVQMTQIYHEDGTVIPVTKIKVSSCVITQLKTMEKDGYTAVQIGYGERKVKNIAKAQQGHSKKLGNFSGYKEFRVEKSDEYAVGDTIEVKQFTEGDVVKVIGTSKGKGFQGVVKRHGFSGQPASHGTKDQLRMPGSIGATGPQRVFKGTRMGGQTGGKQVTATNLQVAKVDAEANELYIKGAVPGARNSVVVIYSV